jgi:hypothetical protein
VVDTVQIELHIFLCIRLLLMGLRNMSEQMELALHTITVITELIILIDIQLIMVMKEVIHNKGRKIKWIWENWLLIQTKWNLMF